MDLDERLEKLKRSALTKIEGAAKSGNSMAIIKHSEILKKTEHLIKGFTQIKAHVTALEENANYQSDSEEAEAVQKEKPAPKVIEKVVSPPTNSEATEDAKSLKVELQEELGEFFSSTTNAIKV